MQKAIRQDRLFCADWAERRSADAAERVTVHKSGRICRGRRRRRESSGSPTWVATQPRLRWSPARGRAAHHIHSAQKSALYFVTHDGVLSMNIGKPVLWAVVPFLCTPHKNPPKISSCGRMGRGAICVRPAVSSRKTFPRICSVFLAFIPLFALYPPFLFQSMPSEKGSRTGAGVRLRVHHVCRCGIHGSGGYQC